MTPLLLAAIATASWAQAPGNTHLVARPGAGNTWTVQARWTTAEPSIGSVEWGATDALGKTTAPEPAECNNHRVDIAGLAGGEPCWVKLPGGEATEVQPPVIPADANERRVVELTVTNPSDRAIPACPVTVGLPFPAGTLGTTDTLRVLIGDGEVVPQARAVSRWDDNSIRWLVLDWQMDLAAGESAAARLAYGGTPAPAQPLLDLIEATANAITAETGAMTLALVDEGYMEYPAFVRSRLTDPDGIDYLNAAEEIEIEENGPYRAVVRYSGHHVAEDGTKHFGFTFRVFVYRGKSYIRLDHVFSNDLLDENMTAIKSLDLVFPGLWSGGQAPYADGDRLVQITEAEYVLAGETSQGRAPGIEHAQGGPCIAVREFWQQWPKSMGVEGQDHVVGLCPTIDPPDLYADKEDEHFLYYHLRDGNHTFRRGLEKRHELWIDPSGVMAEETALMATQRVLATAPAEWYADSAALGDILPSEGDRIGIYDRIVDGNIGAYGKRRDDSREFGLMNYGDWYGERGYNWGNLEYDTHHGFLTQYLRSGDTRFLIEGEIAARHNMDIDVIHHAEGQVSPPEWSGAKLPGQVWVHSMGHTGGYYPPEYLDMNVYAQGYATNRGHIWSQGMWEYSLLTGDTRAWECAKLVSDWAAGPQTTNFRFGNQREPGWMTILVMAAYRATGDPYYLNAARIMIDKVYEERDASPMPESGLRYRELVPGHCTCEEHHWGAAGFMAGVLMTGMKMYYQETGDEEVAENIVKIARFCVDTMYEEDAGLFRYTSCPNSSQSASYGFILGNGIGFAANYADDDSLRTVVRDYLVRTMASFQGIGGGKTIGFYMCFAPYALSEVAKFPGESFDAYMAREVHRATSPGLRRLPGLVPNPDFEIDVAGWQKRGGTMTLDGEDPHSGASCAKIEGRFDKANEYITTVYGTPGEWQISWLVPRKEYRLSTWLKVESITDGAPAPDIRLSHRENNMTKGSFMSETAYDLDRLGEWQQLGCTFTVPENTNQAYLAVNTQSKEAIDVVMYVDDWRLVPIEAPAIFDPEHVLVDIAAGNASATVVGGRYHVWSQALTNAAGATLGVSCGGANAGTATVNADAWEWIEVGEGIDLAAGEHEIELTVADGIEVKAVCLTTDIAK